MLKVLQLLLADPRVDPGDEEIFLAACYHGQTENVKLLLQDCRVEPTSQALCMAVGQMRTGVVRLLLEDGRINPSDMDNEALRLAVNNNFGEIEQMIREKCQEVIKSNPL